MHQPIDEKIKLFVDETCDQIRCKKVHTDIKKELENHILDQKDAFLASGLTEECATKEAIATMGSPIIAGQQLDRIYRPKPAWSVILLTGVLLLLGIFFRFLLLNTVADVPVTQSIAFILITTFMGILSFTIAYFVDYSLLGQYTKPIYMILTIIGFIITLPFFQGINGVPMFINGSSQYGYYIILLIIPVYGTVVYHCRNIGIQGVLYCGAAYVIPFILCLYIYGTVTSFLLLTISCLTILTVAILKGWFGRQRLLFILIVYIPLVIVLLIALLYLKERPFMLTMFRPELYADTYGYQAIQLKNIVQNAQLIGKSYYGGMESAIPSSFFSNSHMITYLIAQYGYCIAIVIVGTFAVFFCFTLKSILKLKNKLGYFVGLSCFLTIAFQFIIYLIPNLGIFFWDPKILPLISGGGMGLVTNLFIIGLLLSTLRNDAMIKEKPFLSEQSTFLQFKDGKIIIDLHFKWNRQKS